MAFSRNTVLAGALAAAVGIPVWMEKSGQTGNGSTDSSITQIESQMMADGTTQLQFWPVSDFREIFNFDLNSSFIASRWSRVSTFPAEDSLTAMRVPLVTGTQEWDLQGSLTYYFDSNKKLRRILFRGWTGDPSALSFFAVDHLGFKRKKANTDGLYIQTQLFQQIGLLRIDRPSIQSQNHPGQRMTVVFEINDPKSTLRLSRQSALLVDSSVTTVSR